MRTDLGILSPRASRQKPAPTATKSEAVPALAPVGNVHGAVMAVTVGADAALKNSIQKISMTPFSAMAFEHHTRAQCKADAGERGSKAMLTCSPS